MKKQISTLTFLLFMMQHAFTQNSKMRIHDGSILVMHVQVWPNALLADPEFLKAKPEKKDKLVAARNAEVQSGKLAPGKFTLNYEVKKEATVAGVDNYQSVTSIAGKTYTSYLAVSRDTLYLYRSKGVVPLEANGESWGFTYQGVEKIPFNLKPGDALPVYEDIGASYPKTTRKVVKEWDEVSRGDAFVLYQQVEVEVLRTSTITSQSYNNVNAMATHTEDIAIDGKTYQALVIESEIWSKVRANTSFESSRKSTAKAQARLGDRALAKGTKRMAKAGFVNEDGFTVLYKEEWFVPELGIVKLRTYDIYGAVVNETSVTGFD